MRLSRGVMSIKSREDCTSPLDGIIARKDPRPTPTPTRKANRAAYAVPLNASTAKKDSQPVEVAVAPTLFRASLIGFHKSV